MKRFKGILMTALVLCISATVYAQDHGMMGSGQDKKVEKSAETLGTKIFNANCNRCHPNGGNVILPNLPIRGSSKLSDFKTFLSFIRDPKTPDGAEGVMPAFSDKQISDKRARALYQYIVSAGSSGTLGNDYGMGRSGMMGGGMGQGMMGRGMMGNGMMGNGMMGNGMMGNGMMGGGMMGGYYQSEECQKFLDETAGLRKELHDKRFEYSEAYRNSKTTPETLVKLERDIFDLQKKIFAKAPLRCGW
jgi:hypothetical protein